MKKITLLLLLLTLISSCSKSDNSSSSTKTSINPPSWIQGYWLKEIDTGEVTDLMGLKVTSNDFYFTQLGAGTSMKSLINNTLKSGATAEVEELVSDTQYKLNIKLNGMSFPQYYFKKITANKIQIFDTAGVGGDFFIKQ